MLCEECKNKPATVHVTKIINNQKTERHLCEECAAKEQHLNFGIVPNFSVHQFLSNLLNYEQKTSPGMQFAFHQPEKCPECGLSYEKLVEGGKLGCRNCYATFNSQIDNLLTRIHGSSDHVGKVPKRTGGKYVKQRELTKLRNSLAEHIQREEFEKAAEIRDKIKALESELNS